MVEAGVVDAVAVHVKIALAVHVFEPGALGLCNHIHHGGGEALVEENPLILFKPRLGFTGEIPVPIPLSRGRGVDVPLFGLRPSVPLILPLDRHEEPPINGMGWNVKMAHYSFIDGPKQEK